MDADRNRVLKALLADRVRLFSYIWAIVRDEHLAEDVFQDVSMLAMDKATEIDDPTNLSVWIRRAARHKALQAVRERSRDALVFSSDAMDQLDTVWDAEDAAPPDETIGALRHCLGKLTPNAQKIVKLRYTDSLTGQDLADKLGKNLTATYVAVSRINKTLADCVKKQLADNPGAEDGQ